VPPLRRAALELPPWKISGVRAALPRQRLGLQAEVADAVEVARQVRLVLGPDALERGDELRCAPVALPMLEYPIRNMA
jgi:hypothetical protein